jgi:hypothetical protein
MDGSRSERARARALHLLAQIAPLPDDSEVQRLRELSLDYIREATTRKGPGARRTDLRGLRHDSARLFCSCSPTSVKNVVRVRGYTGFVVLRQMQAQGSNGREVHPGANWRSLVESIRLLRGSGGNTLGPRRPRLSTVRLTISAHQE